MTTLEQHHDLALMLFVARTLPDGLPWSVDEDRRLIHRERILWVSLTPAEQETEQRTLLELWEKTGDKRVIQTNPSWGDWARNLGEVVIPDKAFGPAQEDFRPELMGAPNPEDYPGFSKVVEWLFRYGFRVTRMTFGVAARHRRSRLAVLRMPIPTHRISKESERLVGLLVRERPHLKLVPPSWVENGVGIWATYDPVSGAAYLQIQGLNDAEFEPDTEH